MMTQRFLYITFAFLLGMAWLLNAVVLDKTSACDAPYSFGATSSPQTTPSPYHFEHFFTSKFSYCGRAILNEVEETSSEDNEFSIPKTTFARLNLVASNLVWEEFSLYDFATFCASHPPLWHSDSIYLTFRNLRI